MLTSVPDSPDPNRTRKSRQDELVLLLGYGKRTRVSHERVLARRVTKFHRSGYPRLAPPSAKAVMLGYMKGGARR
ncbi:MAG TPA: hypothetical protein VGI79_06225 [Caulobacteraceae bacterium]|jgi:hypothetical protein